MDDPPERAPQRRAPAALPAQLVGLVLGALRGALGGACFGAAAGAEQVLRQGYVANGLPRNAFMELSARVAPLATWGAAVGFAAALVLLVVRLLLRGAPRAASLRACVVAFVVTATFGAGLAAVPRARELLAGPRVWLIAVAGALVLARAGWLLARAVRDEPADGARRRFPWGDAVPAAVLGLLLSVDDAVVARLQPARPQNVLLIAIDTLRLDRTSLTGAEVPGEFTPRLGAWAAGATVFANAVSQAPWTLPAFASIFTGAYPRQHGAVTLTGALRDRETSLAEVLREAGYRTGAVISNYALRRGAGLEQGFDVYDTSQIGGPDHISSEGVTRRARAFLEQRDERPFFLFVHYMDPHATFRDHADRTEADGYTGWLREASHRVRDLREVQDRMGPEDVEFLRRLYDEEVAHCDEQVGLLLDHLRASGLAEETVVVFVSDHGEEFLERGWLGHTQHLHDELIHVPFAIDLPDVPDAPAVVESQVETRALPATLLDYLGIERELAVEAPSLLPLLRGEGGSVANDAFSEVWLRQPPKGSDIPRSRTSCLRTERWKLILTHETGALRLFDLEADPGETRDVAAEHPEVLSDLRSRLDGWLAQQPGASGGAAASDEETERALRALGY